jgi:hypothetical protein
LWSARELLAIDTSLYEASADRCGFHIGWRLWLLTNTHLIRPVLAFFKDRSDFDGIDFSTTLRLATDSGTDGSPLAVEFISPLKLLSAYADFDTTGQQLIEAGFVLHQLEPRSSRSRFCMSVEEDGFLGSYF